jgi:mono/diheme cytochrome c family protein
MTRYLIFSAWQNQARNLRLSVFFVFGISAACGGSPSSPTSTSLPVAAEDAAVLSSIQTQIFTPKCAGCHGNAVQQAGLNLASGSSFSSLVNVKSSQTSITLVVPGNPNDSYLIQKLEGRSGISGDRMPQGGPFLTDAEVESITDWITAGALDN